jgi:nucleoside-diphosphate-sugar epimerase
MGTVLADQLRNYGHEVSLYSVMGNPAYDTPGTRPDAIDGADMDQVRQACKGASVVYLCLNAHYVDWYKNFPPALHAATEGAISANAKFVYADNLYMYGPIDGPLTEDIPNTTKPLKGVLRGDMANTVLEAHNSQKVEAVIGRAADMYGPGALNSSSGSTFGQRHFYPALEGKVVSILGDIDLPHVYIHVDDYVRGLAILAKNDAALGKVWHIPSAPALTHRELGEIVIQEAGFPAKVQGSKISGYFVRVIGKFQPDVDEVAELLYQYERPLIVDFSKFENAFGLNVTPHKKALRRTLDWYRENPLASLNL